MTREEEKAAFATVATLAADTGADDGAIHDDTVRDYIDSLERLMIVEAQPRRWAVFEVKLGQGTIDEAAGTLRTFADRIDTSKCGRLALLAVIMGNGYGSMRLDGVAVIPVVAIAP